MPPNPSSNITRQKKQLRREAKARRAALTPQQRRAVSSALTKSAARHLPHLLAERLGLAPADAPIAAYVAIGDEYDCSALMQNLHGQNFPLALPCAQSKSAPLVFRRFKPGDEMQSGAYNIPEPSPSASLIIPKLILVPLLAFDPAGNRLGYGGGYYDRTLAELRAQTSLLAIGLAFAVQQVEALPHEETDQKLDYILTEQELMVCSQ